MTARGQIDDYSKKTCHTISEPSRVIGQKGCKQKNRSKRRRARQGQRHIRTQVPQEPDPHPSTCSQSATCLLTADLISLYGTRKPCAVFVLCRARQSELCAWCNQAWDVSVTQSCFSSAILTLNCKRVCAFNGRFGFLRIGFLCLQCVTLADLPRKQRSAASSTQNNETLRRGPVYRLPRVS